MDASESTQDQYASFLVRLWRSAEQELDNSGAAWHGEIEHIQSGQVWRFAEMEVLLGWLQQVTEPGRTAL